MRPRPICPRTQGASFDWMRRYGEFHGRRNPADLGEEQVTAFLNDSAMRGTIGASTPNQARAALPYLKRGSAEVRSPADRLHGE